jgi:uncharacterized protein (DUF983 family)
MTSVTRSAPGARGLRASGSLAVVPALWQDGVLRRRTMTMRDVARTMRSGLGLRCPRCGEAPLFRGWFTMCERCARCGLVFEREQGYFVGAIYVNYIVTVGLCGAGFLVLESWADLTSTTQIAIWSVVGVVFPLVFFRYSRSLWLSIEYLVNPGLE